MLFIDDVLSLEKSSFNKSKATKLIIHGWIHNGNVDWVVQMREGNLTEYTECATCKIEI